MIHELMHPMHGWHDQIIEPVRYNGAQTVLAGNPVSSGWDDEGRDQYHHFEMEVEGNDERNEIFNPYGNVERVKR